MAQEQENKIESVVITPDYNQLFNMFSADFTLNGKSLSAMPLEYHRDAHGILASLNVALMSATSFEEINDLRNRLADVVEQSSNLIATKQEQADREEEEN